MLFILDNLDLPGKFMTLASATVALSETTSSSFLKDFTHKKDKNATERTIAHCLKLYLENSERRVFFDYVVFLLLKFLRQIRLISKAIHCSARLPSKINIWQDAFKFSSVVIV